MIVLTGAEAGTASRQNRRKKPRRRVSDLGGREKKLERL